MILGSLYRLYDRLEQNPDYGVAGMGYSRQNISFRVVLNEDGSLLDVQVVSTVEGRTGVPMIVPGGDKPSGGVTPKSVHKKVNLLRNDTAFLLGFQVDSGKKLALAMLEFEAFREYHLRLRDQIGGDEFATVCRFLETWNPREEVDKRAEWVEFGGGQGVFQICGRPHYVHEHAAVRAWWDSEQSSTTPAEEPAAQCLITGEWLPIARLHTPKIKGVRDAQTSGAPVVSFDKGSDAFASYGGDGAQGLNAPVSKTAAFRYATALNALTAGPKSFKHKFTLGDATVVFWTQEPTNTEDIFARFATGNITPASSESQDEGLRQKIELFLKALRKGHEAYTELDQNPDLTPFYLLGLTGQAKGRIGVRFFYADTVSSLLDSLRRHYADIDIVRWFTVGSKRPDPEYPGLSQMLDEVCPRDNKGEARREQIPPVVEGPLLRAVLTGTQYPIGLYAGVLRRIHADRTVNYVRACIIAGYLRRNLKQEVSVSLDTQRQDAPYRLGRLFAVLERVQELAHFRQTGNDLEKGIRDTYFGAACSTPAAVFPRLERLSSHHRRHLQPGEKHHFDRVVADIRHGQTELLAVLSLKEQGVFILGYYHQWKKLREKSNVATEQSN